ncbi:BREX-1 system adenine-specific DNA-methyltransferase PglX [Geobacillus kaustophilus]|uniref:BREX-1 system adenine-specific DNA-methyltransferase PglX n=2 Tax=Geobacillus TaxID=129337 RepID=UPI0027DAF8E1|nr:BREX-1 system adenine-specific DNA-methyltransferase PglX [Geobacillus kaustophilus]WMJ21558.1 BREX-1 system adenine-specific DNA-methyltransferase PglX [Geobacillus kaustophilus]
MNKTELKNFAIFARRNLLEKVTLRAKLFGIDEKNGLEMREEFGQLYVNGQPYELKMKSAFQSLAKQLKAKGYKQLIEEVAYTWFNRIIAIRYMEVNDYLPERVNVLSSSTGKTEPDILSQFETMDLDIDVTEIKDLINQGEIEKAYRKLFIAQCNALHKILPFLFEKINDYTELLLPDFLLDSESIIKKLVNNEALTESFQEVEVIGWLYQFYNTELKDQVFANLKKNKKIEKYDIPAATQLFTPKWIVQYMVENSLGQLWLEANPDSPLKQSMRYYIEPAEQDEEVKQKLEEIRYKNVNLEEIKIIDPCVGSGHILVYAFDLLYQMYEEAGYPSSDIPQLILEKNLFGLDIDDRAAQLASFALMMKAREKSRRIFRKKVKLNIYAIQESNHLDKEGIAQLLGQNEEEKEEIRSVIDTFIDAKNFGSILQPPKLDYDKYLNRIEELGEEQLTVETFKAYEQMKDVLNTLKQAKLLVSKYDVAITNPPYMGFNGMNTELKDFLRSNFPYTKGDLSTVFMERAFNFTNKNGFVTMINIPSWMFLSSYEKLRTNLIKNSIFYNLVHLGRGIFGSDFGTVTFVLRNNELIKFKGTYKRLIDKQGEVDSLDEKERKFFDTKRIFYTSQIKYSSIPGSPIAYWVSEKVINIYKSSEKLGEIAEPRQGLATADNDRFLRLWHEVSYSEIGYNFESIQQASASEFRWFPYNKGGEFRKWYGNQEYIVDWYKDGREIRNFKDSNGKIKSRPQNTAYYFKEGITWTLLSSSKFGVRYIPKGFIFDINGMTMFVDSAKLNFLLGFMCSKIAFEQLKIINPTLAFQIGDIKRLPIVFGNEAMINRINRLVEKNILIAKKDWDSFETSWNFKRHPLLTYREGSNLLSDAFFNWTNHTEKQFAQLKANEEELNRIFIDLYGLQDELTPEVPDEEITIRKSDRIRDAKSFLSYFIGCVMGRYSLDVDGLAYAGGDWDESKYKTFKPNKYGLILLTDEHYFEDDVIARLREFLSVTFGAETVEENLQWLAESLELKRNETAEERLRRYFLDEFFKDHCQVYQKRPIYWLVDSGKQKGLRTLIYMHRYRPDTMATIRFNHLQEIQTKYHNEINAIELRMVNPNLSATEKRELEKRKNAYQKRLEELLEFDKKLAEYANAQIDIDLDDGVKVNYEKFKDVLAPIK